MPGGAAAASIRLKSRGKPKEDESDFGSESVGVVGTFETLRDEGGHFMHVGQFQKSVESFTKALEMNEGDKHCLVMRSKCYLQLGEAVSALKDAELALSQESDFIPALYRKAEALYQQGDFEMALVFYHRGNKLRPELPNFLLGISKAQEAINNSIGSPSTMKLKANGDLSIFEKHQEEKNRKPQKEGYRKPTQKVEEKKVRERPVTTGNSRVMKELLEELAVDKKYLESLLSDASLTQNQTNTSLEIRNLILDELDYIDSRVNFWQRQKPLSAQTKKKKKSIHMKLKNDESQIILNDLEEIDNELLRGNFQKAVDKAKKTLKSVENSSVTKVSEKFLFLANLHSCLGNGFMELEKMELAEWHHQKDLEISEKNKYDTGRATDNLGRTYAKMGKYRKAINMWEGKLASKLMPIEKTWLYHEIGRCYHELGEYEQSYDFGQMSLSVAEEMEEQDWMMNASLLCAQSLVSQKQSSAALPYYEQVMMIAKTEGRTEVEEKMKSILEDLYLSETEKGEEEREGEREGEEEEEERELNEEDDISLDLSPRNENTNFEKTENETEPEVPNLERTIQEIQESPEVKKEENGF